MNVNHFQELGQLEMSTTELKGGDLSSRIFRMEVRV